MSALTVQVVAAHWEPMSGWYRQTLVSRHGCPVAFVYDLGHSEPWEGGTVADAIWDERIVTNLEFAGKLKGEPGEDLDEFEGNQPNAPRVFRDDRGSAIIGTPGNWDVFEEDNADAPLTAAILLAVNLLERAA